MKLNVRSWQSFILTITLLGISIFVFRIPVLEYFHRVKFDIKSNQNPISTKEGIASVISNFPKVRYDDLPRAYKSYTLSDKPKYKKLVDQKAFYSLTRDDFFRYLVDDVRVKDLLSLIHI